MHTYTANRAPIGIYIHAYKQTYLKHTHIHAFMHTYIHTYIPATTKLKINTNIYAYTLSSAFFSTSLFFSPLSAHSALTLVSPTSPLFSPHPLATSYRSSFSFALPWLLPLPPSPS